MNFIASYGNSDSEDDADPRSASGVSIKRPLDNQSDQPLKKTANSITARLPVPFAVLKTSNEHIDEPALHNNRIRSFPHERGNWATFIHLPWTMSPRLTQEISLILLRCKEYNVNLTVCEDFHVSLSRTVVLRHHWIEGFNSSIKKQIEDFTSFSLYLQDLAVFVNEERTRTFLGKAFNKNKLSDQTSTQLLVAFNIDDSSNSLDFIVQQLNCILQEYHLPTFYEKPSHHMSFAWCIGDRKEELESIISNYNATCSIVADRGCQFTEVISRIGNMRFSYPLKSQQFL